ncbi:MAG: nucleoside deaminase [bacterium]
MAQVNRYDEKFMRLAIEAAKKGIKTGQTPFGSCIVKGGKVISIAHNRVWGKIDITAHAEVEAIRKACASLKSVDLSGCTVYSTCEPCPMCFSACHWANAERIVYGAAIRDAKKAGFNEMSVSNRALGRSAKSGVRITGGILRGQCMELFRIWSARKDKKTY